MSRSATTTDHAAAALAEVERFYDAVRDAVVESGAALRRLAPHRHLLTELFDRGAA